MDAASTYSFFKCPPKLPTYAYEYETARDVDHYLVPYYNIEVSTQIMQEGVHYDDLSEDEQIEWFEVLNNAGSRVSALQMRFSKMKIHGIDIYTQYTNIFRDRLLEHGYNFFVPKKTEVSYPIATLNSAYEIITGKEHTEAYTPIPSDTKENQLCSLKPSEIQRCFELTLKALDKALQFIQEHNLQEPDRIDYITYLTGYFVYYPDNMGKEVENKLCEWYMNVNFKNQSNTGRRTEFKKLLNIKS